MIQIPIFHKFPKSNKPKLDSKYILIGNQCPKFYYEKINFITCNECRYYIKYIKWHETEAEIKYLIQCKRK